MLIKANLKIITILLTLLTLSGCAGYTTKLNCPGKPGVTCKSVLQIRDGIERKSKTPKVVSSSMGVAVAPSQNYSDNAVVRTPEKILKVQIAPYEDENGVFHHQSYIDVVVTNPRWQTK